MSRTEARPPLPHAARSDEHVAGHWLLARLGKRVLRPGGAAMTSRLLADAALTGADVVELAPGLGRTAAEIVAAGPASYTGVDQDPDAAARVARVVGDAGTCNVGEAAATGLPDASTDVVVGEAMLTMQGERGKAEIRAEVARVLRPGGRYAIHELALRPDDLDEAVKTAVRRSLARSIKVNARPLTIAEWSTLLVEAGFVVDTVRTAPMELLAVRRNIADEGVLGVLRIVGNVLRQPDARRRVLDMRATFRRHRDALVAVSIVAHVPPTTAHGSGAARSTTVSA